MTHPRDVPRNAVGFLQGFIEGLGDAARHALPGGGQPDTEVPPAVGLQRLQQQGQVKGSRAGLRHRFHRLNVW